MITNFPFQNHASPAPLSVLADQRIIAVHHVDFAGVENKGEIVMHHSVVTDVQDFFAEAFRLRFPIHSVRPVHEAPFLFNDESSCIANNSSGFNYRTVYNTTRLSKHSFGLAFDINPVQNIYCTFDSEGNEVYRLPKQGSYDPSVPGTLTANHPLVQLMKEKGWTWGGEWTVASGRVDYQHFEKPIE